MEISEFRQSLCELLRISEEILKITSNEIVKYKSWSFPKNPKETPAKILAEIVRISVFLQRKFKSADKNLRKLIFEVIDGVIGSKILCYQE